MNPYTLLAGKPEGKRPLENQDVRGVDCTDLAQDRDLSELL
jgi:hypothetical protein